MVREISSQDGIVQYDGSGSCRLVRENTVIARTRKENAPAVVIFYRTTWRVCRETGVDRPGIRPRGHKTVHHPRPNLKRDYKCVREPNVVHFQLSICQKREQFSGTRYPNLSELARRALSGFSTCTIPRGKFATLKVRDRERYNSVCSATERLVEMKGVEYPSQALNLNRVGGRRREGPPRSRGDRRQ
jgi:hypothetical protein